MRFCKLSLCYQRVNLAEQKATFYINKYLSNFGFLICYAMIRVECDLFMKSLFDLVLEGNYLYTRLLIVTLLNVSRTSFISCKRKQMIYLRNMHSRLLRSFHNYDTHQFCTWSSKSQWLKCTDCEIISFEMSI